MRERMIAVLRYIDPQTAEKICRAIRYEARTDRTLDQCQNALATNKFAFWGGLIARGRYFTSLQECQAQTRERSWEVLDASF